MSVAAGGGDCCGRRFVKIASGACVTEENMARACPHERKRGDKAFWCKGREKERGEV